MRPGVRVTPGGGPFWFTPPDRGPPKLGQFRRKAPNRFHLRIPARLLAVSVYGLCFGCGQGAIVNPNLIHIACEIPATRSAAPASLAVANID